jgi:steroid delta-isomerase-like uncharacterized protein
VDATDVAAGYFAAWNARDADAVAATFAEDGLYRDPGVPQGLGPAETAGYASGLWAAFPDLSFAVEDVAGDDEGRVWARWLMTGTNTGPFAGLPPTGRPISLPGAVSLTVLEVRSPEETTEVRALSQRIVAELLETPGFISWLGVTVGARMYTISAWETPDAVSALHRTSAHGEATRRFFGPGFAAGGQTGVWEPHRLNGLWVRCTACDEMVPASAGRCAAGHELPEAPAYW